MNHDQDMRAERPSIAAYRGNGVNIRFLCGACNKPRNQLNSKIVNHLGARVRICEECTNRWPGKALKPRKVKT